MFAVNRTHSVIGRMTILTVSTKTMKFIRGVGVPWGVMCDRTLFVFFIKPNITEDDHMVRDSGRVNVPWEDVASVCGNMAEMLMTIKAKIVVITIFPEPFFSSIRLDDSLCKDCITDIKVDFGVLVGLEVFVNIRTVTVAADKYLIFIRDDEGSNMENMFLIIFSFSLSVLS